MTKIEQLNQDVLIIYGESDLDFIHENAKALDNACKKSTLIAIPDAAHLINMEQPKQFN